jgi:uncharacterized membrane protein YadS
VIEAKSYQISFALAVVFVLNSVALFLFSGVGHSASTCRRLKVWVLAAIAIHDTSSVVGRFGLWREGVGCCYNCKTDPCPVDHSVDLGFVFLQQDE